MDRREAYKAIALFGLVSLLGDVIYEGARGITPSYLGYLGASAFVIGLTFGLGEFISFGLRIFSGVIADKTRAYWTLYAIGYLLIIAIPLLAIADSWWIVVLLILIERFAKSFRSPARDTLLSMISEEVGAGKTFGFHELMDQIGAVLGPAVLGAILLWTSGDYKLAFTVLAIPYLGLLFAVIYTYGRIRPFLESAIRGSKHIGLREITRILPMESKMYILAVTLNTIGLIHWSLILHQASLIEAAWVVTFLYVGIQLIDAVTAPVSGYLYDKMGRKILIVPFLLSIIPTALTMISGWSNLIVAGVFFGVVYGMQESIYRAAIADLVPLEARGSAYGLFNGFYGLGLLISGSVFGYMLTSGNIVSAIVYSVALQGIASIVLLKSVKLF